MRILIIILILLVILIFISACSLFNIADNHISNKLKRQGLKFRKLHTPNYELTYWDTEEADKPIFVLFHGFGSSTRFQWHQQVKPLCKHYRLILPNLLYFGSMPNQDAYRIDDQVDAMKQLIEHLKIDTFTLGGISYGGVVAAELGLHYPDQIKQLTLFSTPVKYFSPEYLDTLQENYEIGDIADFLVPKDVEAMRKMLRVVTYRKPNVPKFILKDVHKNLYAKQSPRQTIGQRELLHTLEADAERLSQRVYDFQCPVLLLWGEADELIPPHIGRQLAEHIPQAELHIIPKAGHAPSVEQRKRFNNLLLSFLGKR